MPETIKSPLSKVILIENDREIEVELSLLDLRKQLFDDSPVLTLTSTDGKYYVIPKLAVKMISSDTNN